MPSSRTADIIAEITISDLAEVQAVLEHVAKLQQLHRELVEVEGMPNGKGSRVWWHRHELLMMEIDLGLGEEFSEGPER